jgi:hypothetical protein
MIFSFRVECEKLHLHSRSVSQLSHRRVLARSIDLLGRDSERIWFARPENELPSREWHLFCQSFEWDHQHCVHHRLLELDRLRWHQRLFFLQSVAQPTLSTKTHSTVHLLAWPTDRSIRSLVGFSSFPTMNVRLPAGDHSNSTLTYLSVRVRDQFGCSVEFDLPPVSITRDTATIAMLINALQSSSSHTSATNQLNSNEIVQLLANGNQNEVNQGLVSLSQMLNTMSTDALQTALTSAANIPATTLFVSSLDRPLTPVSDSNMPLFLFRSSPISLPHSPTLRLRPSTRHRLLPNTINNEIRWPRCWTT